MPDFTPFDRNKKKRGEKNSGRISFLDYIALVFTIIFALLLLLAYLAPRVNPNAFSGFAFLGLCASVLYIVNAVFMLYWIIRWMSFAFIPMAVIFLGIGNLPLFFRPSLSKDYGSEKERDAFTFMSYNVMGFIDPDAADGKGSSMEDVTGFINTFSPDILCMQEYQTTAVINREKIDQHLSQLPYRRVNYRITWDDGGWGLAIYSRYRILRDGVIEFDGSTNSVMWTDLLMRRDTIRVLNAHLQTTSMKQSDMNFIMHEFVQGNDTENKKQQVRSIIKRLSDNYKIRADQADSIAVHIERSPYPVIICGDFNDTPVSYTYKTIRGDMRDAFVEKGRGMTNTYRGFFNLFRIDYVLHSRGLEALNYSNPQSDLSDHNPVVVDMRIKY